MMEQAGYNDSSRLPFRALRRYSSFALSNGFRIFELGLASTVGWALTFILPVISAAQIYLLRHQSGLVEINP
ncbi:MAG: hypothetical protein IT329_13375 [Caldilineaceae bacterium]|nr:hypothetical protein [Caldilineaceae bacterium]